MRSGKPLDVILHCTHILAFCNFAQIHSPLDLIFCYFIPVRLNFLKSRLDLIIVTSVSVLDGETTRIPVTLLSAQVVAVVLGSTFFSLEETSELEVSEFKSFLVEGQLSRVEDL